MSVAELEDEIVAVATALGVVKQGQLDATFFSDPLAHLRTIVSNSDQRSALVTALDGLLPPATADGTQQSGDATTTRHPIVHTEHGTLALSIVRSGAADDPTVVVGLWGSATHHASGATVEVDLPLVQGDQLGATVIAASPDHPLLVTAGVPVGWTRPDHPIGLAAVRLSALVIAPPHLDDSRITLELSGLDVGAGPNDLVLDPGNLAADLSHTLTTLLIAGLHQAQDGASDLVTQLVAHLPSVLGLDGELPTLPIGELISDAGAFRRWLGTLLTATVDARPALLHWLDQIGQLLGAPALAAALTDLPGPADPLVIPVVDGGVNGFGVAVVAWVQTPAASTTPELHIAVQAGITGSVAALRAEAELLVVPLGGNTAVTAVPSAQLVIESVGPLWPRGTGTDTALRVGVARGGLRYDGTHVVPVLELDGVFVDIAGVTAQPLTFDRLDLTSARTLAAAANEAVQQFLVDHLGPTGFGTALLDLLGLGQNAGLDRFAAFANDPLRAIGAFHRAALTAGTYDSIAQQILALFGVTSPLTGAGTAADPWFAPLIGVPVPAASTLSIGLAVWDVPSGADHELHIGLRAATPSPSARPGWSVALDIDLVTFALPAGRAMHAGFLGGIDLTATVLLPQATGAVVTADTAQFTLHWAPGAALVTDLSLTGVEITIDGAPVTLGAIALPAGLGSDMIDSAWDAVRTLLARAAAAWGGSPAAALTALFGLGDELGALPTGWPTLTLPAGGITALLADPLAVLRDQLAAIVNAGVTDLGEIPLRSALDQVTALLGGTLPSIPRPDLPPLPTGPQVTGSGTYDQPWSIPLTDAGTPLVAEPIELITWLEPGPPADWAAAALGVLAADSPDVAGVLGDLASWLPDVQAALAGLDPDRMTSWLSAAGDAIDGTDGLVPPYGGDDLPPGVLPGPVVTAAHHLVPQAADAVAAVAAHLDTHAAGAPVVLIAPSFAPSDVWSGVLAAVPADQQVRVDLRVPGVDSGQVDLGGVVEATHYLVDLADDGTPTSDVLGARLDRVVQRVLALTGASTVALVGHSIAGVTAAAYAVAHPSVCAAVATLAAPFVPLDPTVILTGESAGGVRLLRTLAPGGLTATPAFDAAIGHLSTALDGCTGGAPTPYPVAAFARALPAGLDLSAVPTLAIGAQVEVGTAAALAATLAAAVPAPAADPPTHLAWGMRAQVDLGPGATSGVGPEVDARVRLDLGRITLVTGAAQPAHPARRLAVDVLIHDPSGWLVGSAGTGAVLDARLRAAQLSVTHTPGASGGTTVDWTLYDGSIRGAGRPVLGLDDPQAPELLNALVGQLAHAATDATSSAAQLLTLLQALGLAGFDAAAHTAAVYSDAITSIRADPHAWFAARLPNVLDTAATTLGLTADPAVAGAARTWRRALGQLPIELVISDQPWSVGIATTGTGLALGATGNVSLAAHLALGAGAAALDLDVELGLAGLTLTWHDGTLSVAAPGVLPATQVLPPPTGSELSDALLHALQTTGLSAAMSVALRDGLGGAVPVGSLTGLVSDAAGWLGDVGRLGAIGGGFDLGRVTSLLDALARLLDLPGPAGVLHLADGLDLSVTAPAAGALTLTVTADDLVLAGADGPTLDASLGVTVAGTGTSRSVTPSGSLAVTIPLGTTDWPSLTVTAGLSPGGLALSITPHGGTAIDLLPSFGGLWDLLTGSVQALLPALLDQLVDRITSAGPSDVFTHVLDVVDALGLRTGTVPKFDSAALAGLVTDIQTGHLVPTPQSLVDLVTTLLPAGAPITVTAAGVAVQVGVTTLPVAGSIALSANLPGAGSAPDIGLSVAGLALGPVVLDLTLADQAGILAVTAGLGVDLTDAVGFSFVPSLQLVAGSGPLSVALLPLGPIPDASDALTLQLAPTPQITPSRDRLGDLITAWGVPILSRAALDAVHDLVDTPLWSGGPSAHTVLHDAGLVVDAASGGGLRPVSPLPDPMTLLRGLLDALTTLQIPVSPDLSVSLYSDGPNWLGIGAKGSIDIPVGDFTLSVLLGTSGIATWTQPPAGLGVLLVDDSGPLAVRPGLALGDVGIRIARTSGALIDTAEIRVGAISAVVQTQVDLSGTAVHADRIHGGVVIEQIGLPLGGASNPTNPIAASLLKPSGGGSGDDQPADPPSDLSIYSDDSGNLQVQINAKAAEQPFYIDVHKTFGPLHIDRIGLLHKMLAAGDGVGALVDGGVSISGLTVDVQGLELDIPLKHPAEMDQWQVDLSGLAVAFRTGPVSIVGGLLKSIQSGTVEYDGQLSVQVGSFGLSAIGAYSKPNDGIDNYTSLFAVVVINAPIGGPPYLFITGLAGGAGYNRQLVVPSDPSAVPTFPLVSVMDDSTTSGDPMGTLRQMSAAMPARRGSYWVAAGVKFTTFELLHTKAMAYVALDRGFEIGLIGLMTMALPTPDTAVVSVELALLARYSSTDNLLAIRAQLTNNSWLISRDCQLTGGFAFYAWFGDNPQVVLTIGGYGPYWQIAPGDPHAAQYPSVPPVGFNWAVGGGIVVKGQTYFALTPHQLAFGGRVEASYDVDPIRVWFIAVLDVELQWDPLHYHFDIGVSIGASFHFTIDLLFGSITIDVSISLGGSVTIDGPPMQGSVTVELEIASVTVGFGSQTPQLFLSWPDFLAKYAALPASAPDDPTDNDPGNGTTATTISYGQLSENPAAKTSSGTVATQPNGTVGAPWQVLPEFGLAVVSKTPLISASILGQTVNSTEFTGAFDLAPMGPHTPAFRSSMTVRLESWDGNEAGAATAVVTLDSAPTYGHFPLATWTTSVPDDTNKVALASSPTMTPAMSGVTLAFPATVHPAATRPDIPVATLVEEGAQVLGLPFAAASAGARSTPAATRSEVPAASPLAASRLDAMIGTSVARHTVTRGHRVGSVAHATLRAAHADHRAYLPVAPGAAHVWTPSASTRVRGRGPAPLRVTLLSASGRVVDDHVAAGTHLDLAVPEGVQRVVVTGGTAPSGPWGWSGSTLLNQVGPATALGNGCTLLLPRPVTAASPAAVERRVRASRLLAGLAGLQTLLPAATRTVVVIVDQLDRSAPDDLVVTAAGLGPLTSRTYGTRRVLAYPVDDAGTGVTVTVASQQAWRIAAVYGLGDDAATWLDRLAADPHCTVLTTTADDTDAPAEYRMWRRPRPAAPTAEATR